ncbi:hypothetical protein ACP4OV_001697 [Aristida adscensionis]
MAMHQGEVDGAPLPFASERHFRVHDVRSLCVSLCPQFRAPGRACLRRRRRQARRRALAADSFELFEPYVAPAAPGPAAIRV